MCLKICDSIVFNTKTGFRFSSPARRVVCPCLKDREITADTPLFIEGSSASFFRIGKLDFRQLKARSICIATEAQPRRSCYDDETLSLQVVKRFGRGVFRNPHAACSLSNTKLDLSVVVCFKAAPFKPQPRIQRLCASRQCLPSVGLHHRPDKLRPVFSIVFIFLVAGHLKNSAKRQLCVLVGPYHLTSIQQRPNQTIYLLRL